MPDFKENLPEPLRKLIKFLITAGILFLIGWLIYLAVAWTLKGMQPKHSHPTDPAETTSQFFQAMQFQDYQHCYRLLNAKLRSATTAGLHSRAEGYYPHFDRVRQYLTQYAGPDFSNDMKIDPAGTRVTFANHVVLTLNIEPTKGSDKKNHYGIRQLNQFPIDAIPGMGVEKYYRGLNRAIESMDGLAGEGEIDDPAEIIRDRPDESKRQRQKRILHAFKTARQLDTRHTVLEWIIREFSREKSTQDFLRELSLDESQSPHIRELAQSALEQ